MILHSNLYLQKYHPAQTHTFTHMHARTQTFGTLNRLTFIFWRPILTLTTTLILDERDRMMGLRDQKIESKTVSNYDSLSVPNKNIIFLLPSVQIWDLLKTCSLCQVVVHQMFNNRLSGDTCWFWTASVKSDHVRVHSWLNAVFTFYLLCLLPLICVCISLTENPTLNATHRLAEQCHMSGLQT